MKSDGSSDPRACESITELLLEYGDLPGALDWATAGVKIILADSGDVPADRHPDANAGLDSLLRLRYRIRNDLRLPEDEYDRMLNG
jgi:hypothetical protein